MTPGSVLQLGDWSSVKFVVFDVDGTLYSQRSLRMRMLRDMFWHVVRSGDRRAIHVVRIYRRIRERLSDQEIFDFERTLVAETAAAAGCSETAVRDIVTEWIEHRPLGYLATCRYPGLPELFSGMRAQGKLLGILSDYPAASKLAAMGLHSDHVVCAGDEAVKLLKPHPRGLQVLMSAAAVTADETILIGDRVERDGIAARRANVRALIRSTRPIAGWQTFAGYDDPVFAPLQVSRSAQLPGSNLAQGAEAISG